MGMRWVHAVAVVVTMVLYLVRQRSVLAAVCRVGTLQSKNSSLMFGLESCGDTSQSPESHPRDECYVCARELFCMKAHCPRPKYKRDPDISVDDENIGHHPHDHE